MKMDKILFKETCDKVLSSAMDKNGVLGNSSQIGTLAEKTVHSVVKNYIEPNPDNQELKVESFYADIINDSGIIEIQNGNFDKLRKKLNTLLDSNTITVVYPVAHIKMLYWINPTTGEISEPRKSPKTGTFHSIFRELYKIKNLLTHPNLNFHIILINMDEYRLLDGWSKNKKSGASKCDRIPTELVNETQINSLDDYKNFIPDGLKVPFTVKDYCKASKIRQRDAQVAVHILNHVGAINRAGKKGRAYLYTYD